MFIGMKLCAYMEAITFQVDLQAQARAHRIGQKREVLVLRFETVSRYLLVFDVLNNG